MLDQILSSLSGQAGDALTQNGLSADQAPDVLKSALSSVQETATEEVASGNVDGLMNMFSGGGSEGGMMDGIVGNLTDKLSGMLGDKAGGIAKMVAPMVIKFIASKFQDGDSNDAGGLMDMLGADSGGMLDKAKGMLGDKLGGMFS